MIAGVSDPPAREDAPSRATRWVPWMLGLALLGLHLSTLTAGNTFDAIIFAQIVERAVGGGGLVVDFFNPHHVLHLPLAAGLTWLAHACGLELGALFVMQVLAAISGAALGGFMAHRLAPVTGMAIAATAAAAASLAAGTWFFATEGETNHLALALAAAALGPVLRILREPAPRRSVIGASVLLALSAAFHMTLGTLWIAFLAVALLARRERLRQVIATLALASALLAIAYVPRVILLQEQVPGWRLRHVLSFSWDAPEGGYLLRGGFQLFGEWHALTTSFGRDGGAFETAASALPWLWLVAGIAALLLRRGGTLLHLSGAWFAGNILLYSAWADINFEFECFMTTPLAVFGACGIAALVTDPRQRMASAAVQAAFAAIIVAGAWRGTIAPQLDPGKNPYRLLADDVAAASAPEDCILVSELAGNSTKVYVAYFGLRRALIPDFCFGPNVSSEESLRRVRRDLAECCASGGRLLALAPLIEDVPGERIGWDAAALRGMLRGLEPKPHLIKPDGTVVLYELRCP